MEVFMREGFRLMIIFIPTESKGLRRIPRRLPKGCNGYMIINTGWSSKLTGGARQEGLTDSDM
jgi:hypothetical protein